MTCYGDLKCETCCKDCCQVENSECTSFTYYRRNHVRAYPPREILSGLS